MNLINLIADSIERVVGGFVGLVFIAIVISAFYTSSELRSSQSDETTRLAGTKLKTSLGDPTMDEAYRTLKRNGLLTGTRSDLTDMDRQRLNAYYAQLRARHGANSGYSGFENSSDEFYENDADKWRDRY